MDLHLVADALAASIPIVLFLSVVVALILFVKYKGTIDALKDAASTYEQVASAYKEQVDQLKAEIDRLNGEIIELKNTILVQKQAIAIAAEDIYNLVVQKIKDGEKS